MRHLVFDLIPELLGAFILWLVHLWRTKLASLSGRLLRRMR